eukprot:1110003-Prorocentrum_minimum.AAC.7
MLEGGWVEALVALRLRWCIPLTKQAREYASERTTPSARRLCHACESLTGCRVTIVSRPQDQRLLPEPGLERRAAAGLGAERGERRGDARGRMDRGR